MPTGKTEPNYRFKCADAGDPDCPWEIAGEDEREVQSQVERHGRDAHNMTIDEDLRNKIRNVINRQAA
jgi:predicted small metal-binding protein